jgi:hypothetical protein
MDTMRVLAPRRRQFDWHPTAEEVEQIVAEMRPIIADFIRRSVAAPAIVAPAGA